jgi:hypothetical protein
MKRIFGVVLALVLVCTLFLAPSRAAACRTCDVTGFWDPNCSHTGCTYCAACEICCGGDPEAGGNCSEYCGGAALLIQGSQISSVNLAEMPSELPDFLTTLSSQGCSTAHQ